MLFAAFLKFSFINRVTTQNALPNRKGKKFVVNHKKTIIIQSTIFTKFGRALTEDWAQLVIILKQLIKKFVNNI